MRHSVRGCIDELGVTLGRNRINWSVIYGEVEEKLALIPTGNVVEMFISLGNLSSEINDRRDWLLSLL